MKPRGLTTKEGAMKNSLRLMLLVVLAAIGISVTGSAKAAYDPKLGPFLTVEQSSYKVGAASTVDFVVFSDPANDATAKMQIFSPAGYSSTLGHAPGTVLGKAFALVKANALGGAILPLAGDVVVGNPADAALMAASLQCTGKSTNPGQEIWVLNTQAPGTGRAGARVREQGRAVPDPADLPARPCERDVPGPADRGRLLRQGRLHERRLERRLPVGRHLHAVHRARRRTRPGRSSTGATPDCPPRSRSSA